VGTCSPARGAIVPLAGAGVARIVIANRTVDKARQLAAEFAPHVGSGCAIAGAGLDGDELGDGDDAAFDVVINATSASLAGAAPPIPDEALAGARLAYDMVYGKGLTPFLRQAQSAGAQRLADGIGMLVEQAAEAFAWWRGVRPDTAPVIARLAKPLV
jgi:shikimate dehydrogenase